MNRRLVDTVLYVSLGLALTTACGPTNPPKPPDPYEDPDAGPDASRSPTCAGACARMRDLGCPLGNKTPRGATCEEVCKNVQENNAGAGFDVRCLSTARSCAATSACR